IGLNDDLSWFRLPFTPAQCSEGFGRNEPFATLSGSVSGQVSRFQCPVHRVATPARDLHQLSDGIWGHRTAVRIAERVENWPLHHADFRLSLSPDVSLAMKAIFFS